MTVAWQIATIKNDKMNFDNVKFETVLTDTALHLVENNFEMKPTQKIILVYFCFTQLTSHGYKLGEILPGI